MIRTGIGVLVYELRKEHIFRSLMAYCILSLPNKKPRVSIRHAF